ncbi:MAG: CDP-alcohol phosphatidyltransferase family protein, partial [Deltaproteobacteria bacterium]|nr:CDP-alcohol phosphatidyltransferase family protein [Deltaproteobacteria bacterium]
NNVSKVVVEDNRILDIGKDIKEYNAYDTSVLLCTPTIFHTLERSTEEYSDATLSGAVRILAGEGRAKAVNVSGCFWVDVIDSTAFKRAENALMDTLRGKPNDGPVFRYFFRPLSAIISRRLVNYRITPNQITLFSFVCSVLAAGIFAVSGYIALLLGGFIALFSMIVDCCDGTVARLKFQVSEYGKWIDALLDRYADAFLLFGLMWHEYAEKMDKLTLFIGFLAIIGSFVLSYTADKYDNLMRDRINRGWEFRVGREVRISIIFLGAISNQVFLTLVVIAIIMNMDTIRRIIICRDNG